MTKIEKRFRLEKFEFELVDFCTKPIGYAIKKVTTDFTDGKATDEDVSNAIVENIISKIFIVSENGTENGKNIEKLEEVKKEDWHKNVFNLMHIRNFETVVENCGKVLNEDVKDKKK